MADAVEFFDDIIIRSPDVEEFPGETQSSAGVGESFASMKLPCLKGEVIKQSCEATCLCPESYYTNCKLIKGSLHLSNYRLRFVAKKDSPINFIEVTNGAISRVEKVGGQSSKGENAYCVDIFCKDIRNLRFAFSQKSKSVSRSSLVDQLQAMAFPLDNDNEMFAFSYRETFLTNGWSVYNAREEYERLGVGTSDKDKDGKLWRLTNINAKYDFCDTYPSVLAVLKSVPDEALKKLTGFRSRGRVPVLSWLHPTKPTSLTRCSQPMVGMTSRRSEHDEAYLQAIYEQDSHCNKLYIMDARPNMNALANMAKGGGYEDDKNYANSELCFLNIHNIHVMRESLRKLKDVVFPTVNDDHFFSLLESTQWLEHIKQILASSQRIAEKIELSHSSVVVHCSDGWDRTAQLTALSMLMLDSHYRRIVGFQVLVEKEWISFGHRFALRTGQGDKDYANSDRAPIFLQFIDCVWQLMCQFPVAFEFNENFLITVLDELYSCRFGTFLYDSEKERKKHDVYERTHSLWSFINSSPKQYTNPLYSVNYNQHILHPAATLRKIKFWKAYYMRWNPNIVRQDPYLQRCQDLVDVVKKLEVMNQEMSSRFNKKENVSASTNL